MESDFVDWLRDRVPKQSAVPIGIGDDAALLNLGTSRCVVCTDMLMDGVDFVLADCNPRLVGRKALAVNLSDLAAMAAHPVAALVSIAVHRDSDQEVLREVYEGLLELANEFGVALIGGDTNSWEHPLAISVTAIGEPTSQGVLTRGGARPGDAIVVTGSFGGSILGKHLEFAPRVIEAIELNKSFKMHACIDVSDGLSLDLHRLATASKCGAVIDLTAIPVADAARQLAARSDDAVTAIDHALADGEDFELVFAVPQKEVDALLASRSIGVPLTRIGDFVPEAGLWQLGPAGERIALAPQGYEH